MAHCLSSYIQSGVARLGTYMDYLLYSPFFVAVVGGVYALWDRQKIIHEFAVLFLNTWYGLPQENQYETSQERDYLFYKQKDVTPWYMPKWMAGKNLLDPIVSFQGATLYVGALPQLHHANYLKEKKCRVVLSLVEEREYNISRFIGNVMQPKDWEEMGIEFHQIPTPDYKPLSKKVLQQAARIASSALQSKKPIYIHCKAGRGRSVAVAAKVVADMTHKTLDESIQILEKARPQISLNNAQKAALYY